IDAATVRLAGGGRDYEISAAIPRPPDGTYEVRLYLPLVPRHEVGSLSIQVPPVEPIPAPTVTPTPPPQCSVEAAWAHNGTAPSRELGLRFGIPLPFRFTVPAQWDVTFSGENCD